MSDQLVAIAAQNCPIPTVEVFRRAAEEADELGLSLGAYLGRRDDVLGPLAAPGMCCHIFATTDPNAGPATGPAQPTRHGSTNVRNRRGHRRTRRGGRHQHHPDSGR